MVDLRGKVALITGGANGIGFGIAQELLCNGVKGISLLDIDSENGNAAVAQLTKRFPQQGVIYLNADVSQKSQFKGAFEETISQYNRLDIVVNNAGVLQEIEWEKCIAVNLQGCINGSLLALDTYLPKTLGNSEGIIINVASIAGLHPYEFCPVYCGTKTGIIGFSRSLSGSNRCRGLNVKVITICPGATATNLLNPAINQVHPDFNDILKQECDSYSYTQSPEELAHHAISIMKTAATGSVWVISDNKSEEIIFPKLFTC